MNETKAVVVWRMRPVALAAAAVWGACAGSASLVVWSGRPVADSLHVVSAAVCALVILCMATESGRWRPWRRILFVPAGFLAHVVLTLPAASAIGILMRMTERERTPPEQKAIFILAALPILVFAMSRSRLFAQRVQVAADALPGDPDPRPDG